MPKRKSEEIIPGVKMSSAMDMALADERNNKVYANLTPEKREAIASVVQTGLRSLIKASSRPPCKKGDLEEIQQRTAEYLIDCRDQQVYPTIAGWSCALGVCRANLYKWFKDERDKEVFAFLDHVRECFSDINTMAAMGGLVNPVVWIFIMKNNFGFSDKTEVSIATGGPALGEEEVDQKALEDKYADVVVDENLDRSFTSGE